MKVSLTLEASIEINDKINDAISDERIKKFFEEKSYSNELDYLYIGIICMSPTFEAFFPSRKPKYTSQTKEYIHKGVSLVKHAKTFEYDLKLDFKVYNELVDIRPQLAIDIINSLDTILSCKQVKKIDLDRFKEDFKLLFKKLNWI